MRAWRPTLRYRVDLDFTGETRWRRDWQAFFREPFELNGLMNQMLDSFATGPY